MRVFRTLEELQRRDLLQLTELARVCGVRYSTIKYYSELQLLPFTQREKRLARYYPRREATARLKWIQKMKARRWTIAEIMIELINIENKDNKNGTL